MSYPDPKTEAEWRRLAAVIWPTATAIFIADDVPQVTALSRRVCLGSVMVNIGMPNELGAMTLLLRFLAGEKP